MIIRPDLPAVNSFTSSTNNKPVDSNNIEQEVVREKNDCDASSASLSVAAKNRIAAENLKASASSIQDRYKAKEVMAYTRENILSQTTSAIEAQANQLPQSVLTLLK